LTLSLPRRAAWLAAAILCAHASDAGQVWADVGDGRLRSDVELLADAGVINLPVSDWPIPVADLDRVLSGVDADKLKSPALRHAYDRVRSAVGVTTEDSIHFSGAGLAAGRPGLLRDYDTPARDDGNVSANLAMYGDRWAMELQVQGVFSPEDKQPVRLDGSNITWRFGNWLFSANTLDKWWGPGWASSLILSNNARPMPALVLERATSAPFDVPVLRWLGPWRFIIYFAAGEAHRPDVKNPLFFGNRLSLRPFRFLEIALSRTAQWCGENVGPPALQGPPRICNFQMFKNLLIGNYTTQYAGYSEKPGHAEAGYEARFNSPWQWLPLAGYVQNIGNDEINRLPARLMKQYGLESWLTLKNGDVVRGFAEYADATCGAGRDPPEFNCAYVNSVFFAGYRYRGLNIGDTADADSILRTVGLRWDRFTGEEWQVKVQSAHFNRGNSFNGETIYNPVSGQGSSLYDSAQVAYRRPLFGGNLFVQLGYERQTPPQAIPDGHAFGYLSWSTVL